MSAPRTCAAHACGEIVVRGQLMCKPHWYSLPKPLRDEVWASWGAYKPSALRGLTGIEVAQRGMRYMAAVRAAREYTVGAAPLTDAMREQQIAFRTARNFPAAKAEPAPAPILETVEAFLQQTAMPPARFGRDAARDSRIVFDMRAGRKISDRLCRRLHHFMAAHRQEALL